jgi:hypothetical protein
VTFDLQLIVTGLDPAIHSADVTVDWYDLGSDLVTKVFVTPAKAGVPCAGATCTGPGDASLRWHDAILAVVRTDRITL